MLPARSREFPVYVDLSDLGSDFFANTNCTDIKVTTSNGTTEVPREIVSCNAGAETGELHFKAPALSDTEDNEFYIYYGSGDADYAASDPLGAEAVWADYAFVSHDGGGFDSVTSTSGAQNGTLTIGGDADPHMGEATLFNGTDAYIDYADTSAQRPTNLTLQAWLKNDGGDWNTVSEYPISKRTGNSGNGYMFWMRNDSGFRLFASDNLSLAICPV
jgi:Low-affinity cAMP phosphodiesterase